MSTKRLRYAGRDQLEDELERDLLASIGNGVFVERIHQTAGDAIQAKVGAVVPEIVQDPSTDEKVVSFLRHEGVSRLRFTEEGDEMVSEPLDRGVFGEKLEGKRQNLVRRAEETLLNVTKEKIAKVQPVGVGLNPIREILIQVNEHDSFEVTKEKHRRYVPLLTGLGYVEAEGPILRPAEDLQKFEQAKGEILNSPEFYDALLGEILQRGYSELVENLGVQHVTPIVRLATTYYWLSAQYGEPLDLGPDDFRTSVKKLHRDYSIQRWKVENYLIEMDRAGILNRKNGSYTRDQDIWEDYQEEAEGALHAVA